MSAVRVRVLRGAEGERGGMIFVEAFFAGLGVGMIVQHLAWLWDIKRGFWVRGPK